MFKNTSKYFRMGANWILKVQLKLRWSVSERQNKEF